GSAPARIGRESQLAARTCIVVGVMPSSFQPPKFGWLPDQQLWFPYIATPANRGWGRYLLVLGRLRDDVTLHAARADVRAMAARLASELPNDKSWSATAVSLHAQITGEVRRPLLVLLGAVTLLLTMAITNVGALMLGFARRREPELALRHAIGAG